jgi:hypothetical protein
VSKFALPSILPFTNKAWCLDKGLNVSTIPPSIHLQICHGRGKIFLFIPKHQDWLWDQSSLLFNGYRGSIPGVKQPGNKVNNYYPSKLRMSGDIPLLPLYAFTALTGITLPFTINSFIHPIKFHPCRQPLFLTFTHLKANSFNNNPIAQWYSRVFLFAYPHI